MILSDSEDSFLCDEEGGVPPPSPPIKYSSLRCRGELVRVNSLVNGVGRKGWRGRQMRKKRRFVSVQSLREISTYPNSVCSCAG